MAYTNILTYFLLNPFIVAAIARLVEEFLLHMHKVSGSILNISISKGLQNI